MKEALNTRDPKQEAFFKTPEFLSLAKQLLDNKYGEGNWYETIPDYYPYRWKYIINIDMIMQWPTIMKQACESLNRPELWMYWLKLPYYDSDYLDDEIINNIMNDYIYDKEKDEG